MVPRKLAHFYRPLTTEVLLQRNNFDAQRTKLTQTQKYLYYHRRSFKLQKAQEHRQLSSYTATEPLKYLPIKHQIVRDCFAYLLFTMHKKKVIHKT